MQLFPKYVHGDISLTARRFPDARFATWCMAWGHWAIGIIHMTPAKVLKARRSRSQAVRAAARAQEIQQGLALGFGLGLVFSALVVGVYQAVTQGAL